MQERGLSIIIPTLNEGDRISNLLTYLWSHSTTGQLEIIVVDAALSSDEIRMKVEENGAIYIRSAYNCRAAQLHEGAERASHPTLAFLHADVVPPESYCEAIEKTLASGHDFGYFSYRFDKMTLPLRINGWFTQFKGIFTGGGDQILFIRRTTYSETGGFDPSCGFMEDFEYHARLVKGGYRYRIVKDSATVSARKYAANSYIKVNLVNLYTLLAFRFGKDLIQLKSMYSRLLDL